MFETKAKKFIARITAGELSEEEAVKELSELLSRSYQEGIDSVQKVEYFTIPQAAERIGIDEETLRKRFLTARRNNPDFGHRSEGSRFSYLLTKMEIEQLSNSLPPGPRPGSKRKTNNPS